MIIRIDEDAATQVTVKAWYAGAPLSYIQPAGGSGISASQIESMAGTLSTSQRLASASAGEVSELSSETSTLPEFVTYSSTNDALTSQIDFHRRVAGAVSSVFGRLFAGRGWPVNGSVGSESEGREFLSSLIQTDDQTQDVVVDPLAPTLSVESVSTTPDICIKPLPGNEISAAQVAMCIKPVQPLSVQYEQMISAMAGFEASESAELIRGQLDDPRESITLAVGSMT
jgi:hypothetical protein